MTKIPYSKVLKSRLNDWQCSSQFILKYKTVLKQATVYSATALMMRGLSIISAPLCMHLLTPDEFGVVALITSFINTGTILFGLGLKQYCAVAYMRHTDDRPQFINQIIVAYIVVALPLLAMALYCRNSLNYWLFFNAISPALLVPILTIIFFSFFVDLINLVLQYEHYVSLVSTMHLTSAAILTGSKLFLLCAQYGPASIVWSHVLSIMPILIIGSWKARPSILIPSVSSSSIKTILSLSLPCIPNALLPWVISASNRWCLAFYTNTHDVGIYALADLFAQLFNFVLFYVWNGSYLPYIFSQYQCRTHEIVSIEKEHIRLMYYILAIGGTGITAGLCITKPLILLCLPAAYHQAITLIWLLLCGQLLLLGTAYASCLLQYHKKLHTIASINIATAAINLAGNILLIPYLGIVGCVAATLAAYASSWGLTLWYHSSLMKNAQ